MADTGKAWARRVPERQAASEIEAATIEAVFAAPGSELRLDEVAVVVRGKDGSPVRLRRGDTLIVRSVEALPDGTVRLRFVTDESLRSVAVRLLAD